MTRSGAISIVVALAGCFSEPEKIETTSADAGSVTAGSEASGSTEADSGGTSTASTGTSAGDTTTTGPGPGGNQYGPCGVATDCPVADSSCLFDTCFPPCGFMVECPASPPPVEAAECVGMRCRLPCLQDDPQCPPDTTCGGVDIGVGDALASCVYDPP